MKLVVGGCIYAFVTQSVFDSVREFVRGEGDKGDDRVLEFVGKYIDDKMCINLTRIRYDNENNQDEEGIKFLGKLTALLASILFSNEEADFENVVIVFLESVGD